MKNTDSSSESLKASESGAAPPDLYYVHTSGEIQHVTEESKTMRKGGTVPAFCGEQVSVDGFSIVLPHETTSPVCAQCQAFLDAGDNGRTPHSALANGQRDSEHMG